MSAAPALRTWRALEGLADLAAPISPNCREHAAACRAAAQTAQEPATRAMLEEESGIWLMLARQNDAMDAALRLLVSAARD